MKQLKFYRILPMIAVLMLSANLSIPAAGEKVVISPEFNRMGENDMVGAYNDVFYLYDIKEDEISVIDFGERYVDGMSGIYGNYHGDVTVYSYANYNGREYQVRKTTAFGTCVNLNKVVFHPGTEIIYGFSQSDVKEVILPEGLLEINGFSQIPGYLYNPGLIEHGNYIKVGFPEKTLSELVIPSTVEKIHAGSISRCRDLTKVVLPDNLRILEKWVLSDNPLTELTLPSRLEEIQQGVGYGTSITTLTIPESVKVIGEDAFSNSALQSLVLPSNPIMMEGAFQKCFNLKEVTVNSTDSYDIDDNCFRYTDYYNCTLRVPVGCAGKYRQAKGWNKFMNIEEFTPADVKSITTSPDSFFKTEGSMVVSLSQSDVEFYSIDGKIAVRLSENADTAHLNPGVYVWRSNGHTGKICIR